MKKAWKLEICGESEAVFEKKAVKKEREKENTAYASENDILI